MRPSPQPVALITGASSGIGRASAVAFAKAGYRVFGTSRKPMTAPANGITMLVADVTDDASVQALIAEVMTASERIDLLVNNAGYALSGAAEESSIGQVQALFETNFHGVVRVTNAVLPIMRARGAGRILNVGSVLGLIPGPFGAYYAASKHAIEGYSESLDHEVRPFGIRVAVIEPWATKTSIEANSPQGDRLVPAYAQTIARYQTAFDAAMAAGRVPLQARPHPGRGLPHAAAGSAPSAPPEGRRVAGAAIRGRRGRGPGSARAPLARGWR